MPSPPPLGHITLRDALSLRSRVSRDAWESEMLCLRPRTLHNVYHQFDETLHVVEGAPWEDAGIARCVMGMDFGFRGETVMLWGIVDLNGTIFIADEIAQTERSLSTHIASIKDRAAQCAWKQPEWIGIDPAGNQRNLHTALSSAKLLQRAGFQVRDRVLSIEEGIETVRARLAPAGDLSTDETLAVRPTLYIHASCTRLIECLRAYHYHPDKHRSAVPVKDDLDHACDALRYLVINLDRPRRLCRHEWA